MVNLTLSEIKEIIKKVIMNMKLNIEVKEEKIRDTHNIFIWVNSGLIKLKDAKLKISPKEFEEELRKSIINVIEKFVDEY